MSIHPVERHRPPEDGGERETLVGQDKDFTLRHALAHLIEETARHCGHLDLVRETLDGETGE